MAVISAIWAQQNDSVDSSQFKDHVTAYRSAMIFSEADCAAQMVACRSSNRGCGFTNQLRKEVIWESFQSGVEFFSLSAPRRCQRCSLRRCCHLRRRVEGTTLQLWVVPKLLDRLRTPCRRCVVTEQLSSFRVAARCVSIACDFLRLCRRSLKFRCFGVCWM